MKSWTLLMSLAVGFILSGCSEDVQDGNGRLRVIFDTDTSVDNTVVTRGEALEGLTAPEAEEFTLSISGPDGDIAGAWNDDLTKYPVGGYYLDAGAYSATALYGDIEDEGFGYPCFGVTEDFTIVKDVTRQVELTARLLNMAVTVEYSDLFKGYFTEYAVVVKRDGVELADFSDQEAGAIAFVKPESFQVEVSYTYQDNGFQERTGSSEFSVAENIAACTHQKIYLDVNQGEGGSVGITVTFNEDLGEPIELPIEAGDEE